jgi:hypothetical protein
VRANQGERTSLGFFFKILWMSGPLFTKVGLDLTKRLDLVNRSDDLQDRLFDVGLAVPHSSWRCRQWRHFDTDGHPIRGNSGRVVEPYSNDRHQRNGRRRNDVRTTVTRVLTEA